MTTSSNTFNHRSGYHKDPLDWVLHWIDLNPHCTLVSGEGKLLADRIRHLEAARPTSQELTALKYAVSRSMDPFDAGALDALYSKLQQVVQEVSDGLG